MNSAIFIATDPNYLVYTNALLNSLAEFGPHVDTYILHYGLDKLHGSFDEAMDYFGRAQTTLPFDIVAWPMSEDDFDLPADPELPISKNLFVKQARFMYMDKIVRIAKYDVVCLLDADLMIVSRNFQKLFKLIAGTQQLLGCNEGFKWPFGPHLQSHGKPLFQQTFRADRFHCSVPIIFDPLYWAQVVDFYNEMAFHSYQLDPEKGTKRMGDIYCWNAAVYACGKQDDVRLLPMETMTQVHYTNSRPCTRMVRTAAGWRTEAGDEVYTVHGRFDRPGYMESQVAATGRYLKQIGVADDGPYGSKQYTATRKTIDLLTEQWHHFAHGSALKLEEGTDDGAEQNETDEGHSDGAGATTAPAEVAS